ncbi:MAG TPA: hypothetical protein PLT58_00380 [Atribacterota bacterium]|nr:hypothetical protein [Atribacterota bacterium]
MSIYNSILRDIKETLKATGLPIETGIFSDEAPREYLVITPMNDIFDLFADNCPQMDLAEARISLFTKGNYMERKNQVTNLLIAADFTITDRRYIGEEPDTGFHHLAIDVAKEYIVTI